MKVKDEEQLLEEVKYPHLEKHKKMHVDFIIKIAMFCKDVMDGNANITHEMIEYFVNWLKKHTSEADLDFKRYL